MTEQEWLECKELRSMLEFLRDRASIRKLRLFACAFCRQAWDLPSVTDCIRQAVETAEDYADGLVGDAELNRRHYTLLSQNYATGPDIPERMEEALVTVAAMATTDPGGQWFFGRLLPGAYNVQQAITRAYLRDPSTPNEMKHAVAREEVKQAAMLRDIFGPLLFRAVIMDPNWLSWNKGRIKKLAQHIDQKRCYDDMPMLADALEKAGSTDTFILNHCRREQLHVKGCWVLDLLLGKEQPPGIAIKQPGLQELSLSQLRRNRKDEKNGLV